MPAPYQVVARRFRPKTFDEVVGQEAVLQSLKSALAADRAPHAFLFSGSRGVGKTTVARILARALNCERGPTPEPCGQCEPCTSILGATNPDVVEIDAASHNLVDDIRELRDRVGFASMGSRFKVYILDEVHMLTRSAFNAFLKTLEEPPPNVVFILATTEVHKVPETIRSRCQVLMFRHVDRGDIVRRLERICEAEGVALDPDVLGEIGASSRGGMRDAETVLERILPEVRRAGETFDVAAFRRLVDRVDLGAAVEAVAELLEGRGGPALHFADAVVSSGIDEREALGTVLDVLRDLLVLKVDGRDSTLVRAGDDWRARLAELAETTEADRLDAMIQAGLIGRERIRRLEDRRIVLEVSLLRMAMAGQLPTLGDLVAAVESGAAAPVSREAAARGSGSARGKAPEGLAGRLVARLRDVKPALVSTIESCALDGPDAQGVVTLTPRSERRMHRDRLATRETLALIREQLAELVGSEVRVVVDDRSHAKAASTPRKPRREPGANVRRLADRFDGSVLDAGDSAS